MSTAGCGPSSSSRRRILASSGASSERIRSYAGCPSNSYRTSRDLRSSSSPSSRSERIERALPSAACAPSGDERQRVGTASAIRLATSAAGPAAPTLRSTSASVARSCATSRASFPTSRASSTALGGETEASIIRRDALSDVRSAQPLVRQPAVAATRASAGKASTPSGPCSLRSCSLIPRKWPDGSARRRGPSSHRGGKSSTRPP